MVVNKVGVTVQPNPATNVSVTENAFSLGSSPVGDESAIYMTGASDVLVGGNVATGFVNGRGFGGSNLTDVTIEQNEFTGNKDGVSFWGNLTFIDVLDNTLSNNSRYGISMKGQDITISGNVISNNGDTGVNVDKHVILTERVTVNDNDLSGNVNFGVKVNTATVTELVDAPGNWWGDTDAAVVQAAANNGVGVDYTPWLASGTDTSGDPGFQGDFSTLYVDDDSPQTGATGPIQEGIDTVSGSTVNVVAGTYNEDVLIDANVTLLSVDGSGATTINGVSTGYTGAVKVAGSVTGANIGTPNHGFTINGAGVAGLYISSGASRVVMGGQRHPERRGQERPGDRGRRQ